MSSYLSWLAPRRNRLILCAVLVAAPIATAVGVPLPFTVLQPGISVNTLGSYQGTEVITITGHPTRQTDGQLRMTTIAATLPDYSPRLPEIVSAWNDPNRAVVPRDSVYPSGQSVSEANQVNQQAMQQSQESATTAALSFVGLSPSQVHVDLKLADVGGPSAGLMFTLGIIDELEGNGSGKQGAAGDLTGGSVVAGTGEIDDSGNVGAVGGVSLKTKAAARDGATVFLVPQGECSDAKVDTPNGLRLVPVTTLDQAVKALEALQSGSGTVPAC
ncbi:S16 family serine protease [Streptacidiphilus jiangxiensis]|uniref:PDZ domain-containing protein n=1 Tax=Streptacidiphilus jiangxiensis TaxID=235985 RepID=A0A1H7RMM4_STRJI|nr:S16 family serine protease [Streptacidiphilus jiangxiensis]SEL61289.1 PDZ domain-containing protein [Streptacidiphilus jiangxiensis]